VSGFHRLHPALQHHIVNTLGWKTLRPLQDQAIEPLLAGDHALLLAPTAGGKTEAAFFPTLSRMLAGEWTGISVLYVSPLRALLNNLEPRLRNYCEMVGRQVSLWHGDIGESARRHIMSKRPDCLLITPESLEVILVSRRWGKARAFGTVRCVIVDEIHAFAGDDRGWHLLALLERIERLAEGEPQRIGLSATVGNPQELLQWLAGSSQGKRTLIAPDMADSTKADVTIDHVESIDNAAIVISRLHRDQKRLVFCDSRSEVELLGSKLRQLGVNTYLSHSSLGREERANAEAAFSTGRACVIVSTSTLELGIDIGDLDRVIQIGAPWAVSSFLQRLGRTGRRPNTVRNCLFLTTSDESFLRAMGLIQLWSEGYVEPVQPPAMPLHLLAQQLMALALQQGGIGIESWRDWIGKMPGFAELDNSDIHTLLQYMLASDILSISDGMLWFGAKGESRFGRRNFMELLSSFTSEPLFMVRYGRQHLGSVDRASFTLRHDKPPVLLLAGRSWIVNHLDWKNRVAFVEPSAEEGKSRWLGSGQPLSPAYCQAIKRVLAGQHPGGELSKRATVALNEARENFYWVKTHQTSLVTEKKQTRWWTFGGLLANSGLAAMLRQTGVKVDRSDNFAIRIEDDPAVVRWNSIMESLRVIPHEDIVTPVDLNALAQLKFSDCLPRELALQELESRLTDRPAILEILGQRWTEVLIE